MMNDELKDVDPDDMDEVLIKIMTSLNMKFGDKELIHIETFGEFCDHIVNKIHLDHADDCTSQQAFYKLRQAISWALGIDGKVILPSSSLVTLLPRQGRRSHVEKMESHLGFSLNILRAPHWITGTLAILLFVSFIVLFFNWQIGLLGLAFSVVGLWCTDRLGSILDVQTVGEVVKKMTQENYLKSRRDPSTCNKSEIEHVLIDCFSNDLDIAKSNLTRETKFV